jgi:hypothetical protein
MTDSRKLSAPLEVPYDLHFSGQANSGGVVCSGAHLLLSGRMNGTLVVEEGASVHMSGQLKGDARVHGTLDVTGQLHGNLQVAETGRATFATGSSMVHAGRTLVVSEDGEFTPLPVHGVSYVITEDTPRWVYQHDGSLRPA